MTAAASGATPTIGERPLPTVKLALPDLFHVRLGLNPQLVGIVELAAQFGLCRGCNCIAMLALTPGQQWKVPFSTKSFDDPSLLPGHAKHAILSRQGGAGMEGLAVGFVAWRKLSGGAAAVLLLGSVRNKGSPPGNGIAASVTERSPPNAGAPLGLIAVTPAQTLYSCTKERIDALAMLCADALLGLIRRGILTQAVLHAIMGDRKGIPLSPHLICDVRDAAPLIAMTINSALLLRALTVDKCLFARSSVIKITRIVPAVGFSR